jgi:hypothetical protein
VKQSGRTGSPPAIRRLYGLPLGDFVRARDALAAELGKAGRDQEADEVRRLAKPSVPVWAINQLARQSPAAVESLIQAVDRLKAAQLGRRPGAELREATGAEREAIGRLRAEAGTILTAAGPRAPTAATLERIAGTLLAAAAGLSSRAALRHGILREEIERPGFEVFGGARPAEPPPARSKGAAGASPAERPGESLQRARTALAAARDEARHAGRLADALETRAAKARRRAAAAAGAADAAAVAAETARQAAGRAAEKLAAAEAALRAIGLAGRG